MYVLNKDFWKKNYNIKRHLSPMQKKKEKEYQCVLLINNLTVHD